MKYSAVKWIGTAVIVAIGLYIAISITYKWKVTEEKAYRLGMPEHSFLLKDGRQLRLAVSVVFKSKIDAEDTAKKKDDLTAVLVSFFKDMDPSALGDGGQAETLKAKLLIELKKAGFPVEYVSFDTSPKIF